MRLAKDEAAVCAALWASIFAHVRQPLIGSTPSRRWRERLGEVQPAQVQRDRFLAVDSRKCLRSAPFPANNALPMLLLVTRGREIRPERVWQNDAGAPPLLMGKGQFVLLEELLAAGCVVSSTRPHNACPCLDYCRKGPV
jgi:hypothetical protein